MNKAPESPPVFPLINWQKYSKTDIETALKFLIAQRIWWMPATRVTRADVEAAIAEALEAKND